MAKNIFGKTRDINKPYAEYQAGNITYRILKTYKMANNETSHYDILYTAAKSPMTYDQWEYGDMYKNDILKYGHLINAEKDWFKTYHD